MRQKIEGNVSGFGAEEYTLERLQVDMQKDAECKLEVKRDGDRSRETEMPREHRDRGLGGDGGKPVPPQLSTKRALLCRKKTTPLVVFIKKKKLNQKM